MVSPWRILESRQTFKDRYLSVRTDRCQHQSGHIVPTYHVLEFTPWVTIVPITTAGNIVLVREYRHGAGEVMVGLPGGVADPGERHWAAVGRRELLEETGYTPADMVPIGTCYPNPATQTNELHFFLALGCERTAGQALDPNEQIEVFETPYERFLAYEDLPVQHGLHAAGLFYAERYFARHPYRRPGG